jgi:uncharacterized membrane protein
MFLLDPTRGRRRRARLRAKANRLARETAQAGDVIARDLSQRTHGALLHAQRSLSEHMVDDRVLSERIRSRIGRIASHPHALAVDVHEGAVVLAGPILRREAARLVPAVARMRGVRSLEDRLARYAQPAHVPGLQGPSRAPASRLPWLQHNWSPSARLGAGLAGTGLLGIALARRGRRRATLAGLSIALLLRALTNLELRRLFGVRAGRCAVKVHKDIYIDAPRHEVFSFFQDITSFPRFMAHLKAVRQSDGGPSHWVAVGPGGLAVTWDAELTAREPDRLLEWRSAAGSAVENAGVVRFESVGTGTRVGVRLEYNPPGGAIGHALALLMGKDPKRALDDDLMRFKSLIESGKATGRCGQVRREELAHGPAAKTPSPQS